ncbi:HIT-like domain-containing protein [Helicostylum pulchrum]|uniref:HIT domain-containing protein n=2 Tax=Mucoraceae TaxID=34489 RepID=A0ABP9YP03_9FUNG|nr:HIT-like domain-containing protein [Helicostylum pulchrum]
MAQHLTEDCLFCKIIRGEIPSCKIAETEKSYCFLDINPLSDGHALVIPKYHAEFLHQVPDDILADMMPLAKKVALASGLDASQYNILQNNGPLAHQVVKHVHFHIIPKPDAKQGLQIGWPQQVVSQDDLKATLGRIKEKL